MRRYLLDTGPLGAYLQGRQAVVHLVAPWLRAQEAATSILAYAEVVEYIKGFPDFIPLHTQLRRLLRHIYPTFSPTVSWSAMPTCAAVSDAPTVLGSSATLTP
jgi:hypothetical protein